MQEVESTASRRLFGRRVIYTEVAEITEGNVIDVLQKALQIHLMNQADIDYLYRYYRGDQPILYREKPIRPEINNQIVENRANEIVSFKTGYQVGEPIQYVARGNNDSISSEILTLNDYMLSEDKPSKDKELVDWSNICGTAYRMVLPDALADVEADEAPFEIFTLDPRYAFVVYSVGLGHKPMMGVRYVVKEDGTLVFSCYTSNRYFEVWNTWSVITSESQILGIPIVEYPANQARLGAFEIVIPLLDAINMTESNRVDGIEQFVQAYWKFVGCRIDEPIFNKFKEMGAIMVPPNDTGGNIDVDLITKDLNQEQIQQLVDSMYNAVLTICGMPNRNGGTSTSDTGSAVIMRDGWSAAEARAKDSELVFKKSEKEFLRLVLRICRDMGSLNLKPSALEIRFTRRNYENIAQKASVLTTMLGCEKIAPELAFTHSGMFSDPQLAYRMSLPYIRKAEDAKQATENGGDDGVSGANHGTKADGSGNKSD